VVYGAFDVVIVGGGVTALAAARLFDINSASVGIICPPAKSFDNKDPETERNYTIIESSKRLLDGLGVWPAIQQSKIGSYKEIEIWDLSSQGHLNFNRPIGYEKPMGWVVPESVLRNTLSSLTKNLPRFSNPKSVTDEGDGCVEVLLDGGRKISSRLLLLVDGYSSSLREQLGFNFNKRSYNQIGIVTDIRTEFPHENKARQWFFEGDVLAFLPKYSGQLSSIVLSIGKSKWEKVQEGGNEVLSRFLTKNSQSTLGQVEVLAAPLCFPLNRGLVDNWFKGKCVLAGSAAHQIHPLAGQGLNLNMMDVASLVECVGVPGTESNWPNKTQLNYYNRWRKSESLALFLVTDTLNKVFSNPLFNLGKIRGRVINKINNVDGLKETLVGRAMGLFGDLPNPLFYLPK